MELVERVRQTMRQLRTQPRRRMSLREIRRSNVRLRSIAIGAICAWAFVATIGVVASRIQARADHHAVQLATRAVDRDALAVRQAVRARQLAAAIQLERLQQCQDANARHARTEQVLGRLLRPYLRHATRGRRRRLRRSERATQKLIGAMVPHYACATLTASP